MPDRGLRLLYLRLGRRGRTRRHLHLRRPHGRARVTRRLVTVPLTRRRVPLADAVGVILAVASVAVTLILVTHAPPPANARRPAAVRRAEWDEYGRQLQAVVNDVSTTTTTVVGPISEPANLGVPPGSTDQLGQAPSNHEDTSPPLGGSAAGGTLASIRACESGGDYSADTGNGYHGAYQYSDETWQAAGGSTVHADDASPAEQDAVTIAYIESGHRGAWPSC